MSIGRNYRYERLLDCVPTYDVSKAGAALEYIARRIDSPLIAEAIERTGTPQILQSGSVPVGVNPEWTTALVKWSREWYSLNCRDTTCDDECLEIVASSCRKLRFLNLSRTRVSCAGIKFLNTHGTLHTLIMDHTNITDECTHTLAGITGMRVLSLTGTRITDEGIRRLSSLQLVALDISHCELVQPAADAFSGFRNLQTISIDRECATDTVLETLVRNNPQIEISICGADR